MTSLLVEVILSICVNGSGFLDNACVDYMNNCAVDKKGEVTEAKIKACLKSYLKGERYKYEEGD